MGTSPPVVTCKKEKPGSLLPEVQHDGIEAKGGVGPWKIMVDDRSAQEHALV